MLRGPRGESKFAAGFLMTTQATEQFGSHSDPEEWREASFHQGRDMRS